MTDFPPASPNDRHRWTREEYHRLGELNFFDDVRVELLNGEIWRIPTPTPLCVTAIYRAANCLKAAFGAGFNIRQHGPLVLSEFNEPEPDIVVVPGSWRDYEDHHPMASEVSSLIEVADVSVDKDRVYKAMLYATAGITDYWVINLIDRQLEVFRDPGLLSGRDSYQYRRVLLADETIAPLFAPQTTIAVSNLFSARKVSE